MGVDIHLYLERWTNVDNPNCPKFKNKSVVRDEKISDILDESISSGYKWVSLDNWFFDSKNDTWECENFYDSRNTRLFSLLAGVRNSGGIKPIDYPRGVPEDASETYVFMCKMWKGNSHSHSYLLLREVLEIDSQVWIDINAENFIDPLREIKGDPDKIRICFFFDS
jgi:hypothetical protein